MSEKQEQAIESIRMGVDGTKKIIEYTKESVGGLEKLVQLNPVVALAFSTVEAHFSDFEYAIELLESKEEPTKKDKECLHKWYNPNDNEKDVRCEKCDKDVGPYVPPKDKDDE